MRNGPHRKDKYLRERRKAQQLVCDDCLALEREARGLSRIRQPQTAGRKMTVPRRTSPKAIFSKTGRPCSFSRAAPADRTDRAGSTTSVEGRDVIALAIAAKDNRVTRRLFQGVIRRRRERTCDPPPLPPRRDSNKNERAVPYPPLPRNELLPVSEHEHSRLSGFRIYLARRDM